LALNFLCASSESFFQASIAAKALEVKEKN
jgi:hypothetical protein